MVLWSQCAQHFLNVLNTFFQLPNVARACMGLSPTGARLGLRSPGTFATLCKAAPMMLCHVFSGSACPWCLYVPLFENTFRLLVGPLGTLLCFGKLAATP